MYAHEARKNRRFTTLKYESENKNMKKNEIALIVAAESSAWESLCEARLVALENSGLPRGCGYDVARNNTDAETERERAAWGASY